MESSLSTLWRFRELLGSLVSRELKARYRGSALGFFWSLINPLLLLTVYSVVFGWVLDGGGRFMPDGDDGQSAVSYPLYLVAGLFPWVWFQTSVLESTMALSVNGGLLRKAVFPANVLPTVTALSNFTHFLLALPILVGAMAIGRFNGQSVLGWESIFVVLVVGLQLLMCVGLGLGLSALNVHFKDVRDLLANVLQLLFFLAPIIYPLWLFEDKSGAAWDTLRAVIRLNPMTPFVLGYQSLLLEARFPAWHVTAQMVAYAIAAMVIGLWLFRRLEDTLAEAA